MAVFIELMIAAMIFAGAGVMEVAFSLAHLRHMLAASVRQPPGSIPTPVVSDKPVAFAPERVRLPETGFASWAILDRRTGEITGSANMRAPSDTMSMVKVWIVADYLRRLSGTPDVGTLASLTSMIRDSDNAAAERIHRLNGRDASIYRMITTCGLTDSYPVRFLWSKTVVSARDVTRLGLCLADGRAAGPTWTGWLLNEMRNVRGVGNFGLRLAFRDEVATTIAIKNGWLLRTEDKLWHISCLAVTDQWTLGVLVRYPGHLGFDHGAELCRSVALQLFPPR